MKLTAKKIETLKPPNGRSRIDVRDELMAGFMVRVSVSGCKVFYLTKRIEGRNKRIKLGTYPLTSLGGAREKAKQILISIEDGSYFNKPEEVVRTTLGELVPRFIEIYSKHHNSDWKRKLALLQKFEPLFHRPVADIHRAEVVRVVDGLIADGMGAGANRTIAAIKKLMNWAVDRGVIEASPLVSMKMPIKEIARDRLLSNSELETVWRLSDADGYPFGDIIKVLLITGQRRSEVSGMRWSEIDFEAATWTLPSSRVKNAKLHMVPLPSEVMDILRSAPRFLKSDFVFTTTGRSPFSGFGKAKARMDSAMNPAEPWRIHDLRRTMATKMAELRVSPHVIEAVLNHRSGVVSGVAATYNRHAYSDEKREALEQWADHLNQLTQSPEAPIGSELSGTTKTNIKSV